jgi:hypothetical protein
MPEGDDGVPLLAARKISLFPSTTNREAQVVLIGFAIFPRPRTGQRSRKPGTEDRLPKGVGNSAPRETFRTGRRKARAKSRFRWRTKRQPVRGTLSSFEPALRAAVSVNAPLLVDVQVGVRDSADETVGDTFRFRATHPCSCYRRDLG